MSRRTMVAGLLLVVCVLAAYLPAVVRGGWIWDDDAYVTSNPHLDGLGGLARIWADRRATPQYYPMVFTTFWVEKRLCGLKPACFHLTNVILHAANALLAWVLLRRLGLLPAAWLAAALFALHPVHVESVAWVTERKNVLSGLFALAALIAYFEYEPPAGNPAGVEPHRSRYAVALALFVLALLSKSVTATLPGVILVLLWWKRGRLGRRELLPLLPFAALGLLFGANTAYLETYRVGTHGPEFALGIAERTIVAGRAIWFYLGKLAWPDPLIFTYPRWNLALRPWWWALYPAAAILTALALLLLRGRIGRGPLAAALLFGGLLLPALGFVNFYPMRYSFVADHFQYLASLAPIALAASGAARVAARLPRGAPPAVAAACLLALLGALTWRQSLVYRDETAVWTDTLAKDPGSANANNYIGNSLHQRGDLAGARAHYERALASKPDFAQAWFNLGLVQGQRGELTAAVRSFERAVKHHPHYAHAFENLGVAYGLLGDPAKAETYLGRAVEINPTHLNAWRNLASARSARGDHAGAAATCRAALTHHPGDGDLLRRLREAQTALRRAGPSGR